MVSAQSGSVRLFRVSGIQVYLHWSWLLVAWWQISSRLGGYSSPAWNVAEYVGLFAIVLLHEFGHAFASRQVGGESKEILLWPFGGIAYVKVPPRPGAELWSIAAGPLVNVALWPLLALAFFQAAPGSPPISMLWDIEVFWNRMPYMSDMVRLIGWLYYINSMVLIFNLLPIYPMDGGQMLRSGLWFLIGRARSLQVATIIGFVGVGAMLVRAFLTQSIFFGLISLFIGQQCLAGFRQAQALLAIARRPRHTGAVCPTCKQAPPGGPLWRCGACGNGFDPFSTRAICPHCQAVQPGIPCPNCGSVHSVDDWGAARRGGGTPNVIDV